MVLGEEALPTNVGGTEVMTGQLEHLLAVLKLPPLRLGIIPMGAPYRVPLNNGFWILDEALVQFTGVSGEEPPRAAGVAVLWLLTHRYHGQTRYSERTVVPARPSPVIASAAAGLSAGMTLMAAADVRGPPLRAEDR